MRLRIAGGRWSPPSRVTDLPASWERWDAPCQGLVHVTVASHLRRSCAVSGEISPAK